MKPVKAWAIVCGDKIAPLKYIALKALTVEERALPVWTRKEDAVRWMNSDTEHVVQVEIREAASKR